MVQVGGVGETTNNLFDISAITTRKYINANGEEKNSTAEYPENYLNHSDYINISPSQNYTFKCVMPSRYTLANTIAFCWFDINKNIISRNTFNINQSTDNYVMSSTSPENATYLIINFIGLVDGAKFSLNVGSTSLPYEPFGYKVPVVVSGKNLFNGELLQGYYTDSTMSTLASKNSNYKSIKIYLKKGKYTLSSNINLLIVRFITSQVYQSNPAGSNLTKTFTFEIENDGYISLAFRNENNQTWDNSTNLQIEIGDTATTYEEYTSPTITTIYLDSPILENESISLSDTNTNIQTVRGTNILTVDTTVQPSKVYVKSRKESPYEIAMRQRYEGIIADYEQQLASIESSLQEV